jgi:hypothetical protein
MAWGTRGDDIIDAGTAVDTVRRRRGTGRCVRAEQAHGCEIHGRAHSAVRVETLRDTPTHGAVHPPPDGE